ncbi:energy transducer TonB [Alcanivorax sp. 1008]|uniref:energy transducer TonB n=1 Tax=Alcanivorax sp. 1008 TaxID=2816853 RepID=UPI001DEE3453|nr:energy transducer TonB [Alcanivorax sp. 1008]MCC1496666.1 energy transducer TonB [Alcanivorax sp. 1008]
MTLRQKLLACGLAVLIHLPLFWQFGEGLQHGDSNAVTASQAGITLKLAGPPAAPPETAPVPPTATPPAKPKPIVTPSPATPTQPVQAPLQESSEDSTEETGDAQPQAVGGQTMGLSGSSEDGANEDALARYKGIIHNRIQRLHRYPQQARLRNQQGTVEVTFNVAADGTIGDYRITSSSGSALLDRAAERLFSRLTLPAPDPSILGELTELTAPVTFTLTAR